MKLYIPSTNLNPVGIINEFVPYAASSILSNSTLGQNTLYYVPFDVDINLNAQRVNFFVSVATTFNNANSTATAFMIHSAAIYSRQSGTANSNIISQIWSQSCLISVSMTSGTAMSFTAFSGITGLGTSASIATYTSTLATSNASTFLATSLAGFREFALPVGLTLTPGRYWLAFAQSTASANATLVLGASIAQQTLANHVAYQPMGTASSASNASTPNLMAGMGTYSATSGAFPTTINLNASVILGAPSMTLPFFNFSGYPTGTAFL